jgi:hypothetical protein
MTLKTQLNCGKALGPSSTKLNLTMIPAEIRSQIYAHMRHLPRRDHLNALCVCKKVYREAEKSYRSRPLCLSSQHQLYQIVLRHQPASLEHVTELTLSLNDLSADEMSPFIIQMVMNDSKSTLQHPYDVEAARITSALRKMPKVTSFSLVQSQSRSKIQAPRLLLNNVLSWVGQHYPNLFELRVDGSDLSLEHMASYRRLRRLHLSPWSGTPGARTAIILARMTDLEELHIVSRGGQGHYFQSQAPCQSVDSETLRRIHPLKSLTVRDLVHTNHQDTPFLTSDTIQAINGQHSSSLQNLQICSVSPLQREAVDDLAANIRNLRQIQSLVLAWPGLEPCFLNCLPSTTWSLEILVSDAEHAMKMMQVLMAIKSRLPKLSKVGFVSLKSCQSESDLVKSLSKVTIGDCTRHKGCRSGVVPWTVTWGVWNPDSAS